MKKKVVPVFRILLSDFYSVMTAKVSYMKRDKVEFAGEGVDESEFDEITQMLKDFSDLPTDEEMVGNGIVATQNKDKVKEMVKKHITTILNKAANRYGTESGYYRKFGISDLSHLDGPELLTSARRVLRVAKGLQTALAEKGLTEAMLTNLASAIDLFDDAIAQQEDTIADRDIATELRTESANSIYVLVAKLCDTGKRIWEQTNEAKYNDYVIYDSPGGGSTNDQNKS